MFWTSETMYKLTVLNMTTAAIENTDGMFKCALIFEWVLLCYGLVETAFLWYLLRYTTQYHRNLSMIVEQLPNQYFPSMLARMFIIYKQLTIQNTDSLIKDESFLFAVWLRNSLLFVAFYFSAFPVFERVFATYFMQDYETNKRRWISYLLSIILYLFSITSAQMFMFGWTGRELHLFLITAFNFVAFVLTFLVERCNKKRYQSIRRNMNAVYSLSTRTQLSENISSTRPFRMMCFSIAFFASLCTTMLHVDEYTESQTIRNWVYISFNYSCWAYGTTVPFFMLASNAQWQRELIRLKNKFCCKPPRINAPQQHYQITRVSDTFGKNCFVDDKKHANVYFSQLNADWNAPLENSKQLSTNSSKIQAATITPRSVTNTSNGTT